MATQNFETLRARVQALGCQLFIDDADDGDPRYYVHSPRVGKHVLVGVPAKEIDDWCVELETEETAPHDPRFATKSERRQRIVETGNFVRAASEVLGMLHTIHGQAHMLCQDTIRENEDMVLSIATAILALAEDGRDLLDRPGGWKQSPCDTEEPADRIANRIAAERDLTAEEARDGLHAETVREIRHEYPDADEREHKLRVAIRESVAGTSYEQDVAYECISKALQS